MPPDPPTPHIAESANRDTLFEIPRYVPGESYDVVSGTRSRLQLCKAINLIVSCNIVNKKDKDGEVLIRNHVKIQIFQSEFQCISFTKELIVTCRYFSGLAAYLRSVRHTFFGPCLSKIDQIYRLKSLHLNKAHLPRYLLKDAIPTIDD